jgi:thioredoxin 1
MMESFFHIDENNFDQEVLKSGTPVLLEFGAVWCGPCKQLEPELAKLEKEWGSKVRLAKVDVDESPNLTVKFGVMGVPTLILFVKGEAKQRMSGYQPRQRILEKMGAYLS